MKKELLMEATRKADLARVVKADLQGQIHRLQCAEVDVPEEWRAGTNEAVPYPEECYHRAYLYACALAPRLPPDEQIWLVHGEYGISTGHAWVELPGDVVFDAVLQRFYRMQAYCDIQLASPWYKYSPVAAMIIAANMPKGGVWHLVLKLPWANPQNPTVIDHHRAVELLIASGLRPDLVEPRKKSRPAKKRGRP